MIRRHPDYPWIVDLENGTIRACERCQKRLVWEKPQTLGRFAVLKHEFMQKHSKCEGSTDE